MGTMTSMQRVLTTLGHKEPDKVPLFLSFTYYGARELGIPIKDYFSDPSNIVEAQLRLRKKYNNDCVNGFFYASLELEAFGSPSLFFDDGPPNAGAPVLYSLKQIDSMGYLPPASEIPCLQKSLQAIRLLKREVGDDVPVIGVAMSPFSLPVMQLGFERYLNLILWEPEHFWKLMEINIAFCVEWANEQVKAGATAICYFDPVSSPSIIPPSIYTKTGDIVARKTIPQIHSAIATHLASGRSLKIIDQISTSGASVLGVSSLEDIEEVKRACNKRISLLGNLNGIEMCRWDARIAEEKVRDVIGKAAPGGGFILSDNHGEIPWNVSHETLAAISAAVEKWGTY